MRWITFLDGSKRLGWRYIQCSPIFSGRCSSSSVQADISATSAAEKKPGTKVQPVSSNWRTDSAAKGEGVSSISGLQSGKNLVPGALDILDEVDFGPGNVGNVGGGEAVRLGQDLVADRLFIFLARAAFRDVSFADIGEFGGHCGRKAEKTDRFAMPIMVE